MFLILFQFDFFRESSGHVSKGNRYFASDNVLVATVKFGICLFKNVGEDLLFVFASSEKPLITAD